MFPSNLIATILPVIGIVLAIIFVSKTYVNAAPDEILIISGLGKTPRTLSGRGGLVIPVIERVSRISLRATEVNVTTSSSVPTKDFIDLYADAVAVVKVSSKEEELKTAMENFLGLSDEEIAEKVQNVLEGNIREIIGSMELIALVNDREGFVNQVEQKAKPDLSKLGISLITFNVQNFRDEKNVINDLGIENVAKIQKNARIAKITSEKEVEIEKAKADLEAATERTQSDKRIAEIENEVTLKKASLLAKANQENAKAEAAYKIEQEIQRSQQEKVTADANAVKAQREIEINRNILVAENNNKEDAKLYAKQKEAESILAVAEARAKALAIEAEAEAQKIEKIGQAEAQALKAKGLAEAEALKEKANAMKEYGQAAIIEQILEAQVKIAENVVKPLENVDSITLYGEGNQAKLVADTTNTMNQINKGLKDSIGVDLQTIINQAIGTRIGVSQAINENSEQ